MLGFFHPERESEISLGGCQSVLLLQEADGYSIQSKVMQMSPSGSLLFSARFRGQCQGPPWMQAVRILSPIVPTPNRSWRVVHHPGSALAPPLMGWGWGAIIGMAAKF